MKKEIFNFIYKIRLPLLLVAFMWTLEILDTIFSLDLKYLGILPRETSGLKGIFTSPFIHSDWGHLLSNTSPMLVLTSIMVLFYRKVAVNAFIVIMIGTGIMVWLFARDSFHIGASGVVYGLVSFVFWTGVFKKNLKSIILALVIVILYAGLLTSIFPNVEENISWESHLFGGIVGLFTAFIFKSVIEDDELLYSINPWENDNTEKEYFLSRDAFEKTKQQRYYEQLEARRIQSNPNNSSIN